MLESNRSVRWYQAFRVRPDGSEHTHNNPFRARPDQAGLWKQRLNLILVPEELREGVRYEVREIPKPMPGELRRLRPAKKGPDRRPRFRSLNT